MTDLRAQWDNVMVPNYSPMDMIPSHGQGSRVWSADNREYIDFAGGIAVNVLGHCHPELVKVLREQSEKIWHLSNVFTNEPSIRLAELLCEHTFADKVYFANSGAEANEAALKLARRYAIEHHGESKNTIIAFRQGFHGRTFFTVTVGGQPSYSDGFGPKPGAIEHCEYNNIEMFESLIDENTCAVMMEPLQGEGGVIQSDPSFAKRVAELCRQYNALLIFDEVQSGVGRTGELYAYMGLNVTPDILTTAKSLGGGFPIGAMLTTTDIAASLKVGTHGSTYGGNALACAVAARTLELVNQPEVLQGAVERELYFREGLAKINEEFSVFSEVRGKGMLLGCVLNEDYKDQAKAFMAKALEKGLMCLVAGPNVIRFAPSIIIPYEDIDLGLAYFRDAIAEVVATKN